MAAQTYAARSEIYVGNRLIAQATNIAWNVTADHSPVTLIIGGVAGFTPAPASIGGSITSAVPETGLEVEFDQFCAVGKVVEQRFIQGGTKQRSACMITAVNRTHAAGQTVEASINFVGTAPEFLS